MEDSSACMLRMMTFGGRATLCTGDATSMPFIFGITFRSTTVRISTSAASAEYRRVRPSSDVLPRIRYEKAPNSWGQWHPLRRRSRRQQLRRCETRVDIGDYSMMACKRGRMQAKPDWPPGCRGSFRARRATLVMALTSVTLRTVPAPSQFPGSACPIVRPTYKQPLRGLGRHLCRFVDLAAGVDRGRLSSSRHRARPPAAQTGKAARRQSHATATVVGGESVADR